MGRLSRGGKSSDVRRKKRRVTLNLDKDVAEALESLGGRSLSAAANDALRVAVAVEAHRVALIRWLDELDARHGSASPDEAAAVDALLDDLFAEQHDRRAS